MAMEFDIRDPKNQRLLAVFMILVVVLYGFYHLLIRPLTVSITTDKTEIATLRNQLASMKSNLQAKNQLLADRETLNQKLAELESYLPDQENVAVLLDQFSMVEDATKVYVLGFKANEASADAGKPYRANKYKVTIEAGYHQFVEFMSGIMALPRILSFSEMRLSPNPNAAGASDTNEGLEDQPRSLSIECSITSYVFGGIDNPAEKEKEKEKPAVMEKGKKK